LHLTTTSLAVFQFDNNPHSKTVEKKSTTFSGRVPDVTLCYTVHFKFLAANISIVQMVSEEYAGMGTV
jgi:hypothetical protein